MATTSDPVALPSTSAPRTRSSFSPSSSCSLLVETTVPTTRPNNIASLRPRLALAAGGTISRAQLAARLVAAPQRQRQVDVRVRPGNDMDADQLPDALGTAGARLR